MEKERQNFVDEIRRLLEKAAPADLAFILTYLTS